MSLLMDTGTPSWEHPEMLKLRMQVAELGVLLNSNSQTTTTAQQLGAIWMELARIRELSCLSRLKEDSTAVETVYSAVLHGFRERLCAMSGRHKHGQHTQSMALSSSDGLGNVTLADMINTNGKDSINEEAKWW